MLRFAQHDKIYFSSRPLGYLRELFAKGLSQRKPHGLLAFVRDPDGNRVEIHLYEPQREPTLPTP